MNPFEPILVAQPIGRYNEQIIYKIGTLHGEEDAVAIASSPEEASQQEPISLMCLLNYAHADALELFDD